MDSPAEPTGKIAPPTWMTAPATATVLAALRAGGADVRFVGGCIRDAILKRPVKDIDIATPEPPETVVERLRGAGIKVIPTGIRHGTVTAVVGDSSFEITTLRVDVETDGRHARVAFTDDWTADAARRDFTINTMSATADGDIFDPFGGIDDLGHGHVRFVGDARQRIEEDILRLLRFFRIYGAYGQPPPDIDALAACRAMAHRLPELSAERIRDEIFRILLGPNAADIIMLMRGERILEEILPEARDVGRLRLLTWLETSAIKLDAVAPDPVRRLAALFDPGAGEEVAAAVATRLRLSNQATERLCILAAAPVRATPETGAPARRRALHRFGADIVRDLALLAWAGELSVTPRRPAARTEAWLDLLGEADTWTPLEFPLKGRDVTALGMPPGPGVGALLGAVEAWWEDGDYRAGREACLEKLRQLAGGDR